MVKLTLTITHDGQPEVAVVEDLGRIEQLSKPSDMVGFTQKPS